MRGDLTAAVGGFSAGDVLRGIAAVGTGGLSEVAIAALERTGALDKIADWVTDEVGASFERILSDPATYLKLGAAMGIMIVPGIGQAAAPYTVAALAEELARKEVERITKDAIDRGKQEIVKQAGAVAGESVRQVGQAIADKANPKIRKRLGAINAALWAKVRTDETTRNQLIDGMAAGVAQAAQGGQVPDPTSVSLVTQKAGRIVTREPAPVVRVALAAGIAPAELFVWLRQAVQGNVQSALKKSGTPDGRYLVQDPFRFATARVRDRVADLLDKTPVLIGLDQMRQAASWGLNAAKKKGGGGFDRTVWHRQFFDKVAGGTQPSAALDQIAIAARADLVLVARQSIQAVPAVAARWATVGLPTAAARLLEILALPEIVAIRDVSARGEAAFRRLQQDGVKNLDQGRDLSLKSATPPPLDLSRVQAAYAHFQADAAAQRGGGLLVGAAVVAALAGGVVVYRRRKKGAR